MIKSDQHEVIEKEYTKLQEKYREIQNIEFNLSTLKEQQDATMKIQVEQLQKLNARYQEDENQWKQDKQELTRQIQDLYINLDKAKRESNMNSQVLKTKYNDYKLKVKQANMQINTLVQRLALYEVQNQARGGIQGSAGAASGAGSIKGPGYSNENSP